MSSRSSSRAAAAHQFPAMARLRAAVAAARSSAGAGGGALLHQGRTGRGRVAEPGADGAGIAADDLADGHLADAEGAGDAGRAVAHHVQGAEPQPGAAGVRRARAMASPGTASTAAAVPRLGWRRPVARSRKVARSRPRRWRWPGRCCRLMPAAERTRTRATAGTAGRVARDGTGRGVDAHLSSPPRPGSRAVGAGLAGPAGGIQGPVDFLVAEAGLAGSLSEGAQVGGGVSLERAVGGPVQAALRLPSGWRASQRARVPRSRCWAGRGPGRCRCGWEGSARQARSQLRVPWRPGVPHGGRGGRRPGRAAPEVAASRAEVHVVPARWPLRWAVPVK